MLRSLSQFQRILAAVIGITICLLIVSATILHSIIDLFEKSDARLEESVHTHNVMQMSRDVAVLHSNTAHYAISGSAGHLFHLRHAADDLEDSIESVLQRQGRRDPYYTNLKTFLSLYRRYLNNYVEPLVSLRQSFDDEKIIHQLVTSFLVDEEQAQTFEEMDAILQSIVDREEQIDQEYKYAQAMSKARLISAMQGAAAALAVLFLLVAWALFRFARTNRELGVVCTRVARGDTSVRLPQRGELDLIPIAVNTMIDALRMAEEHANRISTGDVESEMAVRGNSDRLAHALNNMTRALREWHQSGRNRLLESTQGDMGLGKLGKSTLATIVGQIDAQVGAFFVPTEGGDQLQLVASYAFPPPRDTALKASSKSGLLGQAITEGRVLVVRDVPPDYLVVASGLGETNPKQIMLVPILYRGKLVGALELATIGEFTHDHVEWVQETVHILAVALYTLASKIRIRSLLEASKLQARQLTDQQEELRSSNEELVEQAERLRSSEEELRQQSEHLQLLNAELVDKNESLDQQKEAIELKNRDLQQAQIDLEERGEQLEVTARYKSEFLANMSHELRTPLNSLLLLSRSLLDNDTGNLELDQLESLEIIDKGGRDLLTLINDILDLAKIEAGKTSVVREKVRVSDIADSMRRQFRHMAADKSIAFDVQIGELAELTLYSDMQRIEQILRNLVSNAIKFTNEGSVTVKIDLSVDDVTVPSGAILPGQGIQFAVRDTGVGIPQNKQLEVWEAFQQADGTTSRRYGGTGLGLTISRQLARALGGEIQLSSELGAGSVFTLILPLDGLTKSLVAGTNLARSHERRPIAEQPGAANNASFSVTEHYSLDDAPNQANDDRAIAGDSQNNFLIIEDDLDFARILLGRARKRSFTGLVATTGAEGVALANRFLPIGIVLDLGLPDMDGISVLDQLKSNLPTRHIPVHVISGREKDQTAMSQGAIGFLQKPISAEDIARVFETIKRLGDADNRRLLIAGGDSQAKLALQELLENSQTIIAFASSCEEVLEACRSTQFDCIVLDLERATMSSVNFLQQLRELVSELPPIIIYSTGELNEQDRTVFQEYSNNLVVKDVRSPEQLLDEASLFLHTVAAKMPMRQRRQLQQLHGSTDVLAGKKVLLVDDDIRNTFALSKVLTKHGMDVLMADDGKLAVDKLTMTDGIDIVLMDIMMPVMDGYEAMEIIRQHGKYHDLPIIALTANAMPEDRKKCLEAGASDYLSKPVDLDKLSSIMRVWLSRST